MSWELIEQAAEIVMAPLKKHESPMVVFDPIPGQEEWNADFVAGSGAGLQLRQAESVPLTVQALLAAPERLALMRQHAARVGRPRAAQEIADRILGDLRSGVYGHGVEGTPAARW